METEQSTKLYNLLREKVIEKFPHFDEDEINKMVFMLTREMDNRISNKMVTELNDEIHKIVKDHDWTKK